MAGTPLHIICVGKIKTDYWKKAIDEYAKRLGRMRRLELTEVRDAGASLAPAQKNAIEAERLLDALSPREYPIVLDERGRDMTSPELARLLARLDDQNLGSPAFLIGGPFGLTDAVRARARVLLRLSAMVLPHELARVILYEQLYRAECIRHNIPYHH